MNLERLHRIQQPLYILALLAVCLGFLCTAWMSDDAFITLRVIDNFLNGYGLRWNISERVQVFTHPLWLMVLTPIIAVTRESFFTVITVHALILMATMIVVARSAFSPFRKTLVLLAFSASTAFIDYSSSGLENGLTHLLLVLMLLRRAEHKGAPDFWQMVLCALLVLNRFDLSLLVAPLCVSNLIGLIRQRGVVDAICMATLAFLPLLLWLGFSTIYFGSPLPNTYYAKVGTDLSSSERWAQGYQYIRDLALTDTGTFVAILLGMTAGLVQTKTRPLALGIVLYLAYLLSIGGDFMAGRFFTAAFVCALWSLCHIPDGRKAVAVLAFLVIAFMLPISGLLVKPERFNVHINQLDSGIADERRFYFSFTGLINNWNSSRWQLHPFFAAGHQARLDRTQFAASCCVGLLGYAAGPDTHIIDVLGLTDPFLARLPILMPWRIGHFERPLLTEYASAVQGHGFEFEDAHLEAVAEDIFRIHSGPILGDDRFGAMMRVLNGDLQSSIEASDLQRNRASLAKKSAKYCHATGHALFLRLEHRND